jgi:ABC-type multidrug transport system ATPase subunit
VSMAAVSTRDLTRRYGDVLAVDEVDLEVAQGEVFGLVGPNGAGKTTTIKMLTTLLPPSSGTATVAGFDVVRDARKVRSSIGYVPQLLSADGSLTGYENLLLSSRLHHLPQTTILLTTHYMDEADELCDRVAVMHLGRVAAIGTPAELKAEVGAGADLDDVFVHFAGSGIEPGGKAGGTFRDVARTRRTAQRLG